MKKYLLWLNALISLFFFDFGCASDSGLGAGDSDWVPVDFVAHCDDLRCDMGVVGEGAVAHGISTWHPADTALGLIGQSVVLAVDDPYAGHPDVPIDCYQVTLLVDFEATVTLELGVDYWSSATGREPGDTDSQDAPNLGLPADGSLVQPVTSRHYQPLTFWVRAPSSWGVMRFSIKKSGAGAASIYLWDIDGAPDCGGPELVMD